MMAVSKQLELLQQAMRMYTSCRPQTVSSKHLTWARLRAIPPGPKKEEWGVQFCTSPKSGPTRV